jgi:hypothetical protein
MTIFLIEKTFYDRDQDNYGRATVEILDHTYYVTRAAALDEVNRLNTPLFEEYKAQNKQTWLNVVAAEKAYDQRVLEHETLVAAGVTPSFGLPTKPSDFVEKDFAEWKSARSHRNGYTSYDVLEIGYNGPDPKAVVTFDGSRPQNVLLLDPDSQDGPPLDKAFVHDGKTLTADAFPVIDLRDPYETYEWAP